MEPWSSQVFNLYSIVCETLNSILLYELDNKVMSNFLGLHHFRSLNRRLYSVHPNDGCIRVLVVDCVPWEPSGSTISIHDSCTNRIGMLSIRSTSGIAFLRPTLDLFKGKYYQCGTAIHQSSMKSGRLSDVFLKLFGWVWSDLLFSTSSCNCTICVCFFLWPKGYMGLPLSPQCRNCNCFRWVFERIPLAWLTFNAWTTRLDASLFL